MLEGAAADERSDLYSLGLTLLNATTGAHPFGVAEGTGLAPLINQICTVGPPDPASLGLPVGLAAVLRRATALDPERRYGDGRALSAALQEVASEPDTVPEGAWSAPPTGTPPRRSRLVTLAAAMAVLVVAAGIVWWRVSASDDTGAAAEKRAIVTTTLPASLGPKATGANGQLGPLYVVDDFTYDGQIKRECKPSERWVAMAVHADQDDRKAGIAEPWKAVSGKNAGTFMAYLPCENGGRSVRYVLRAPGRWFVLIAAFPQDQYDRMVGWMRENETSPAPDYTVDEPIIATLTDPANYLGWAIIDRAQ